jgi:hypothetical protein
LWRFALVVRVREEGWETEEEFCVGDTFKSSAEYSLHVTKTPFRMATALALAVPNVGQYTANTQQGIRSLDMIIVSKIADCHRWSFYLSIKNVVRVYDLNCFFIVPVDAIVLFCFLKSPGVTRLPDSNRRTLPK